MTHYYSIGQSVRGTPLAVLAIAASNASNHVTLRAEVKYVGNMHGNEVVGRELILRFAQWLLESYGTDDRITRLLDKARVHLMPTMNPDGFDDARLGTCTGVGGRPNANGLDLNRNFPEHFDLNYKPKRQPETQAVMDWAKGTQFVISANMHGGAVVANYPYDNNKGGRKRFFWSGASNSYSASPDDALFISLASTYASHNKPMKESKEFTNGITNGAHWYPLPGGMQDWMYLQAGCMELTLEVSDCKYPRYDAIDGFWGDNKESMLALLFRGLGGVKGIVKDSNNNALKDVGVSVVGRSSVVFKTTKDGEFWRMLMPGEHQLEFTSTCCGSQRVDVTVPTQDAEYNIEAAVVNVVLSKNVKNRA